jgi:hypothetical protein
MFLSQYLSMPQYKNADPVKLARFEYGANPDYQTVSFDEFYDAFDDTDNQSATQGNPLFTASPQMNTGIQSAQQQVPSSDHSQDGLADDFIDMVQMGAAGVGSSIVTGIDTGLNYLGVDTPDLGIAKGLQEISDDQLNQIAPERLADYTNTGFEEDEEGNLKLKDGFTWTGALMHIGQGVGSMIPTMIGGGVVGKGLSMVGRGAAARLGSKAAQASKALNAPTGKLPKALGYGAVGGQAMGGGTATAVREKMESIPLETMAKSKPFQVVYNVMKEEAAKAGETIDDMELARRAREVVIDEAVNSGYLQMAGIGSMTSGILGPMLEKALVGRLAGSYVSNVLRAGAIETVQEGVESGAEQGIANLNVQKYGNPDQKVMEGVKAASAMGATIGGLTGSTVAAGTRPLASLTGFGKREAPTQEALDAVNQPVDSTQVDSNETPATEDGSIDLNNAEQVEALAQASSTPDRVTTMENNSIDGAEQQVAPLNTAGVPDPAQVAVGGMPAGPDPVSVLPDAPAQQAAQQQAPQATVPMPAPEQAPAAGLGNPVTVPTEEQYTDRIMADRAREQAIFDAQRDDQTAQQRAAQSQQNTPTYPDVNEFNNNRDLDGLNQERLRRENEGDTDGATLVAMQIKYQKELNQGNFDNPAAETAAMNNYERITQSLEAHNKRTKSSTKKPIKPAMKKEEWLGIVDDGTTSFAPITERIINAEMSNPNSDALLKVGKLAITASGNQSLFGKPVTAGLLNAWVTKQYSDLGIVENNLADPTVGVNQNGAPAEQAIEPESIGPATSDESLESDRTSITNYILKKQQDKDKKAGPLSSEASTAIVTLAVNDAPQVEKFDKKDRRQMIDMRVVSVEASYGINGANAYLSTLMSEINPTDETASPSPEKLYLEYKENLSGRLFAKSYKQWLREDYISDEVTPEEVDAAVEEAVVEEAVSTEAAVDTVPVVNKATKKKAAKKKAAKKVATKKVAKKVDETPAKKVDEAPTTAVDEKVEAKSKDKDSAPKGKGSPQKTAAKTKEKVAKKKADKQTATTPPTATVASMGTSDTKTDAEARLASMTKDDLDKLALPEINQLIMDLNSGVPFVDTFDGNLKYAVAGPKVPLGDDKSIKLNALSQRQSGLTGVPVAAPVVMKAEVDKTKSDAAKKEANLDKVKSDAKDAVAKAVAQHTEAEKKLRKMSEEDISALKLPAVKALITGLDDQATLVEGENETAGLVDVNRTKTGKPNGPAADLKLALMNHKGKVNDSVEAAAKKPLAEVEKSASATDTAEVTNEQVKETKAKSETKTEKVESETKPKATQESAEEVDEESEPKTKKGKALTAKKLAFLQDAMGKNLIKHDRKYKFHFATNDPVVAQEYKDVMGAGVEIRGPEGELLGIRIQERTINTWEKMGITVRSNLVPTLTTKQKVQKELAFERFLNKLKESGLNKADATTAALAAKAYLVRDDIVPLLASSGRNLLVLSRPLNDQESKAAKDRDFSDGSESGNTTALIFDTREEAIAATPDSEQMTEEGVWMDTEMSPDKWVLEYKLVYTNEKTGDIKKYESKDLALNAKRNMAMGEATDTSEAMQYKAYAVDGSWYLARDLEAIVQADKEEIELLKGAMPLRNDLLEQAKKYKNVITHEGNVPLTVISNRSSAINSKFMASEVANEEAQRLAAADVTKGGDGDVIVSIVQKSLKPYDIEVNKDGSVLVKGNPTLIRGLVNSRKRERDIGSGENFKGGSRVIKETGQTVGGSVGVTYSKEEASILEDIIGEETGYFFVLGAVEGETQVKVSLLASDYEKYLDLRAKALGNEFNQSKKSAGVGASSVADNNSLVAVTQEGRALTFPDKETAYLYMEDKYGLGSGFKVITDQESFGLGFNPDNELATEFVTPEGEVITEVLESEIEASGSIASADIAGRELDVEAISVVSTAEDSIEVANVSDEDMDNSEYINVDGAPLSVNSLFQKPYQIFGAGMSVKVAQAGVDEIVATWSNPPEIVVLKSLTSLPENTVASLVGDSNVDEIQINGFFAPEDNKAYIIADQIHNYAQLKRILQHEVIGHYSTRDLFGSEFDGKMLELWNKIGQMDGLTKLAEKYDFDMKPYMESGKLTSEKMAAVVLTDEILAHFVENNIEPTLMQKIIQMIRNGLQAIGFNLPSSETELFKVIAKARRHVIKGKAKGTIFTTAPAALSTNPSEVQSEYLRLLYDFDAVTSPAENLLRGDFKEVLRKAVIANKKGKGNVVEYQIDDALSILDKALSKLKKKSELVINKPYNLENFNGETKAVVDEFVTILDGNLTEILASAKKAFDQNDTATVTAKIGESVAELERILSKPLDMKSILARERPAALSVKSKNNRSAYITKSKVKARPKQGKRLPYAAKIEHIHEISQEQGGSNTGEAYITLTVPKSISKQITRILYRSLPERMRNDFAWPTTTSSSGDIFRVYGNGANDIEGAQVNVEKIRYELSKSPVYYSRISPSGKKGISNRNIGDVETWLSGTKFAEAKAKGHKVVVIQSTTDSPHPVEKGTRGFYVPETKTSYIVADHIGSKSEAQKVFAHEVIGHYGMMEMLGPKFDVLANTIQDLKVSGDAGILAASEVVSQRYGKLDPQEESAEIISYMAEQSTDHSIMKKVLNEIRIWIKSVLGMAISSSDIDALIGQAGRHVTNNKAGSETGSQNLSDVYRAAGVSSEEAYKVLVDAEPEINKAAGDVAKSHLAGIKGAVTNIDGNKARYFLRGALTTEQIIRVYGNIFNWSDGNPLEKIAKLNRGFRVDREKSLHSFEQDEAAWDKLSSKDSEAVAKFMREATIAGAHPDIELSHSRHDYVREEEALLAELNAKYKAGKLVSKTQLELLANTRENVRDMKQEHARLRKQWLTMNNQQKIVYNETRDLLSGLWADEIEALAERIQRQIPDKSLADNAISDMTAQMKGQLLRGPYFPLSRFGNHVVIGWMNVGGKQEFTREHFETKRDAVKRADELIKVLGKSNVRQGTMAEMSGQASGMGDLFSFKNNLFGVLDENFQRTMSDERLTTPQKNEVQNTLTNLKTQINELLLNTLPNSSIMQRRRHRQKTQGSSTDMRRSVQNVVLQTTFQISKIKYSDQITGEINKIKKEEKEHLSVDGKPKFDEKHANLVPIIRDEMERRFKVTMEPNGSPFAAFAGRLAFFNYLGFSISAAVTNLTQVPLIGIPLLGSRYGVGKATTAIFGAIADYNKGEAKLSTRDSFRTFARNNAAITKDEESIVKLHVDRGDIDVTRVGSLVEEAHSDQRNPSVMSPHTQKLMRVGSWMFHNAEIANREVMTMAAFRLAKEAAKDPSNHLHEAFKGPLNFDSGNMSANEELIYEEVRKWIADTQFVYDVENRPRFMRESNVVRTATIFKLYGQHVIFMWAQNLREANYGILNKVFAEDFDGTPEEKAQRVREARRSLRNMFVVQTLAAGALGVFPVGMAMWAAEMIHDLMPDDDDDDNHFNPEQAFQQSMDELMGSMFDDEDDSKFFATLMTKGIGNSLGVDLHSRIAQDKNIIVSMPDREFRDGEDYFESMVTSLGGPIVGLGSDWFKAAHAVSDDGGLRSLESALPKFLRDTSRATRYADVNPFFDKGGVTTKKGLKIVEDISAFEIGTQAVGFNPSRISEVNERRFAGVKAAQALSEFKSKKLTEFYNAIDSGDKDDIREAVEGIKKYNSYVLKNLKNKSVVNQYYAKKGGLISMGTIRTSIKTRLRMEREAINGVNIPKSQRWLLEDITFGRE